MRITPSRGSQIPPRSCKVYEFSACIYPETFYINGTVAGCGSVWPERCVRDAEAGGSNPLTPTIFSILRSVLQAPWSSSTAISSRVWRSRKKSRSTAAGSSSAGPETTSQPCLRNHQIKHPVCRTYHPQVSEKRNGSGEVHFRKPFMMVGSSRIPVCRFRRKRDNSASSPF